MILAMSSPIDQDLEAVIDRHFTDPARTVRLDAGQVLLRQGQPNTRLYRVRTGAVCGRIADEAGGSSEVMRATEGNLVGVQSFFGSGVQSAQTITALQPTELGYIERDMPIKPGEPSLERLLMPIVLGELLRRQRAAHEFAERERQTRERLDQLERVSVLGQLAAGVAHELNNALTVLVRGTSWIAQTIQSRVDDNERVLHRAFDAGITHGRGASAAEVRQRTPMIEKRFGLPYAQARRIAQTGLSEGQLGSFEPLKTNADRIIQLWELGATIHDMQLAAEQSEHVVKSMRELGANRVAVDESVDVNDTIRIALKILRGQLESIEVEARLGDLPAIRASRGKLVQVWTNLIKNAVEAMTGAGTPTNRPKILIVSRASATHLTVTIEDSGPGIPADVLPRIFEPSFTTKKQGLHFGLGLGLSIVQAILQQYGASIAAESDGMGRGAAFTVTIPIQARDWRGVLAAGLA